MAVGLRGAAAKPATATGRHLFQLGTWRIDAFLSLKAKPVSTHPYIYFSSVQTREREREREREELGGPSWHFGSPIHPDQSIGISLAGTTRKLGDVVPISTPRIEDY